jgi:hypothetical protein
VGGVTGVDDVAGAVGSGVEMVADGVGFTGVVSVAVGAGVDPETAGDAVSEADPPGLAGVVLGLSVGSVVRPVSLPSLPESDAQLHTEARTRSVEMRRMGEGCPGRSRFIRGIRCDGTGT